MLGRIRLDPATDADNHVGADNFFTEAENGLAQEWNVDGVYLNPPWGKQTPTRLEWWAARCWDYAQEHPDWGLILLTPASVNGKWFHRYLVRGGAKICFPDGRLSYLNLQGKPVAGTNFDSSVAYWGPNRLLFASIFSEIGWVP